MSNVKFQIVQSKNEGYELAKNLLYKDCDRNTVLFLSGGSTPGPLYKTLASEQKLKVGALAMVDDRYSLHEQYSNEFMIRESGLVSFLEKKNVPFYPILRYGLSRKQTAREYETGVKFLFEQYKKKIAILGIGADGHIASIQPSYFNNVHHYSNKLVEDVSNFPGEIKERITLTLNAISKMDLIIVLAFGEEKKEGIRIASKNFFKENLAKKTILITNNPIIQSLN